MTGYVDRAGRAFVRIGIKPSETATAVDVDAWVDTRFTGELVLPQERIAALRLTRSAVVKAALGGCFGNPARYVHVLDRMVG